MSENLSKESIWNGGKRPFVSTYGKLMMWFFLISDALTFSGFLAAYGFMRFRNAEIWPVPEDVFTHFPFLQGEHPLLFVALMTFILIMSSVTMVLAVNAGNKNNKKGVVLWMALTIVGGVTFLGSQAWEWGHFIHGDKGAIKLSNHEVIHVVDADHKLYSLYDLMNVDKYDGTDHQFSIEEIETAFNARPDLCLKRANRTIVPHLESEEFFENSQVVLGANLTHNEYGHQLFADFFYFITGFHGFHVFSGVVLLIIIFINVLQGTYERRGHYEMVEKVGLYWHFVDLVWVFVFTFFYLV